MRVLSPFAPALHIHSLLLPMRTWHAEPLTNPERNHFDAQRKTPGKDQRCNFRVSLHFGHPQGCSLFPCKGDAVPFEENPTRHLITWCGEIGCLLKQLVLWKRTEPYGDPDVGSCTRFRTRFGTRSAIEGNGTLVCWIFIPGIGFCCHNSEDPMSWERLVMRNAATARTSCLLQH